MRHHLIVGFIALLVLCPVLHSRAAVTSTGEINVQDDNQGRVPASSTVTLIVTLIIDRSLAEPGEEIKTIELLLPTGFVVQASGVQSLTRDGQRLVIAQVEIVGSSLRIVLTEEISDFRNSTYELIFDSRTPNTITNQAVFRARLRNLQDIQIGEFIKPGQADGKVNNDDFTLQVIPNVPPLAVQGFAVESDTTGENNVMLQWDKSTDLDVSGYFVYRDADPRIDVKVDRESTRRTETFIDVNVLPGPHSYAIEAYKTPLLRSQRSDPIRVVVSEDTAPPKPPQRLVVVASGQGIVVTWQSSISRDVATYRILSGRSRDELQTVVDGEILVNNPNQVDYEFIDLRRLGVGSFVYSVEATDEAGNRSEPIFEVFRILGEPAPNPFTPLSSNPDFNQIAFPARAVEDAEGEFVVRVFDINGVLVWAAMADPGVEEVKWDGRDENGEVVESGVYVYQIQVGESFDTGTIVVAK